MIEEREKGKERKSNERGERKKKLKYQIESYSNTINIHIYCSNNEYVHC